MKKKIVSLRYVCITVSPQVSLHVTRCSTIFSHAVLMKTMGKYCGTKTVHLG